ncbi:MAG: hypothetical protein HQK87_08265 [Nitrospinae bacterium]|nr:hypothetical protein [Nitrospinota bacterium]
MGRFTPLHPFSRIVLGLVLAWALFMALRLGITVAGVVLLVLGAFWIWLRSGRGDSW